MWLLLLVVYNAKPFNYICTIIFYSLWFQIISFYGLFEMHHWTQKCDINKMSYNNDEMDAILREQSITKTYDTNSTWVQHQHLPQV